MARSIKCPHCGQVLKAGEDAAGKRVNCPACKKAFLAPKALSGKTAAPPPVSTSGREWHVHVDGRNDGPYSAAALIEQLKTGRIGAETLVWHEGMNDWLPMSKVQEFRGALATPPPVGKSKHRPPGRAASRKGQDDDADRRHHYIPGRKSKHDALIGIWVAVGLAVALLIVILIVVYSVRDEEPPVTQGATRTAVPGPAPATKDLPEGIIVVRGPKPLARPTKQIVRKASNERLLTVLVADLDKGFTSAIAAHKRADRKPIYNLSLKCKTHADKIAARKWEGYQGAVDTLVLRLNQASEGLKTELKERSEAWDLGEGLDPKKKAELLGLDKVDWLQRWQNHLNEELTRIRKKGLQF